MDASDKNPFWPYILNPLSYAYVDLIGQNPSISSTQFLAGPATAGAEPAFRALTITDIALFAPITASLGADVALNNTANYFLGPSVAQGTAGTWFVSGNVTLQDTSAAAYVDAKLWDGTTVIASGRSTITSASVTVSLHLSGYLASPAGDLRISAKDATTTNGKILFNATGNSKDSTITAIRIA